MKNLKYFPFERNQYFYGKLLSVDDFQTEQKYMNDKRRLINRFLHGCGVVCGLNVVQVDDCTLSLETGLALDFAGREIVVDAPVTRKLSMIEGFDAYTEEDEDSSYLYLCIEYAERDKDPVYNVTGSASREAEYNKVAEGYHLYVTNREPEGGSVSGRSYMEEQKVIYWGNGIRISQVFPRFAESGKEFPFTVVVENMGQKLPIQFSYELQLECLEHGGESRIRISFDENDFEKSRRYEVPFFLTASDVKKRQGKARLEKGSFQLGIGGHSLELDAECVSTVQIEREDAGRVLSGRYYREAMEEILKDTYHQSIYLAKISVIQAGTTFVIDGIEQMPFQQYVYSEVLAGMMNRVLEEKVERLERRLASRPQADRDAGTPGSGLLPDVPQASTGSVVLDLGIGKCRMCVAGPAEAAELLRHQQLIRVATKYPVIAKDYFYNRKHQTVEIIKLNGSVELAPIVGLSEVIVDIVETGTTLKENGLQVLEEICDLSAKVVVNQVSMKMENQRITQMIQDLRGALA